MAKDNVTVIEPEKGGAAPSQAFTFPDGGWKAWSTVAGAWLVLFVSFGYVNAFGEPHLFLATDAGSQAFGWPLIRDLC